MVAGRVEKRHGNGGGMVRLIMNEMGELVAAAGLELRGRKLG